MLKRTIEIAAVLAVVAFFSGCAGPEGNNPFRQETLLDMNWGRSVESARFNQMIDPDAGKNLRPVEGLSGVAAGYSVDKYEQSFKEKTMEQSTTTTTIAK
jgi:hypothetical protein